MSRERELPWRDRLPARQRHFDVHQWPDGELYRCAHCPEQFGGEQPDLYRELVKPDAPGVLVAPTTETVTIIEPTVLRLSFFSR